MNDLDDGLMTDSADDFTGSSGDARLPEESPLDAVVASAVRGFDAGAKSRVSSRLRWPRRSARSSRPPSTKALTPERHQLLAETAPEAVEAEFRTMTGESAGPAEPEVENHFPNVYVFMQDFLVKVQARPVRDGLALHWCSQWWDHPEAVSRLEALWKAFEVLRRDPGTGAATWWRDYADPTMAALSDAAGTFAKCSDTSPCRTPGPADGAARCVAARVGWVNPERLTEKVRPRSRAHFFSAQLRWVAGVQGAGTTDAAFLASMNASDVSSVQ